MMANIASKIVRDIDKSILVDVHAHLCYEDFSSDIDSLVSSFSEYHLRHVVVNGLEPKTNLVTLELSHKYPEIIKAAAGIYPIHAVNHLLSEGDDLKIADFDLFAELGKIEDLAACGDIVAVGECGLDGYWFCGHEREAEYLEAQEEVFSKLVSIATHYDIPVIVHSRKKEKRVLELLSQLHAKRVIMHCYMGSVKAAVQAAKEHGWCFSIPAISQRHDGFTKMLRELPEHCILTETDSPYLAFAKGERNDPRGVIHVISHLSTLRNISPLLAAEMIWRNYRSVFSL